MRHGEILTRIIVPYRFNHPLLLGSWQGQPLVSLHKLTKTESHQILGGGLPEALSLDIKTPAKQRDLKGKFKKRNSANGRNPSRGGRIIMCLWNAIFRRR
jgi:hypothetical protein